MRKINQTGLLLFLASILGMAVPHCVESSSQYGLPKSGQTAIFHQPVLPYDLGDDGAIQAGFPIFGSQYTDNGNGTVTDNGTGLIWQQNDSGNQVFGGYAGPMNWNQAYSYINAMNALEYGGRTDWRLPNMLELMSIIAFNSKYLSIDTTYFPAAQAVIYWTSTSFPREPLDEKWALHFRGGFAQFEYQPTVYNFLVRAVAGGTVNVGSTWGLPATGQIISYHAGDDGGLQAGYPFSGDRFIFNNDGTVQDLATGLAWQFTDSVSYKLSQYPFGILTWEETFGYVRQLNLNNYCGHRDWRVPNIKELASIVNYGRWVPATWNILTCASEMYWSSTSDSLTYGDNNHAFWLEFTNGLFEIWNADKDTKFYVKAVRGPEGIAPIPTPTPITNLRFSLDSGDYNGDGTSEIGLFRSSTGLWAIRGETRIYFGQSSDIPISGDYNGDGTTDIGLFRSSYGLWALRSLTRVYFGGGSDLPVPGDYTGDGTCTIGIFRPSSGLWAIRGITRIYFGSVTDQPIPGYYRGTKSKSIGIFRQDAGLWAIRGVTRSYFGSTNDIPIPGDFSGDGSFSIGIFRKSLGLWAIQGLTRTYFGGTMDIPVPGNYAGINTADIGIFRENSGLWAVTGITRTYFGTTGDIPVTTFSLNPSSSLTP